MEGLSQTIELIYGPAHVERSWVIIDLFEVSYDVDVFIFGTHFKIVIKAAELCVLSQCVAYCGLLGLVAYFKAFVVHLKGLHRELLEVGIRAI